MHGLRLLHAVPAERGDPRIFAAMNMHRVGPDGGGEATPAGPEAAAGC